MADFAITSTHVDNPVDTRWRASHHGQTTAQPGTLDLTEFVEGVHYNIGGRTDFVIPSGVAVQLDKDSGMYVPWVPGTPAEGDEGEPGYKPAVEAEPVAGFINDNEGVEIKRADGTVSETSPFARLLHGFVDVAFLPVATQAAALKGAPHAVQVSYL